MSHRTQDHREQDVDSQLMPKPDSHEQAPVYQQVRPAHAVQRAKEGHSPTLVPSEILALQRVVGNRSVRRLVAHEPEGTQGYSHLPKAISRLERGGTGDRVRQQAEEGAQASLQRISLLPGVRQLGTRLSVSQTGQRRTKRTDFGSLLKAGLSKAADCALQAASIAAPFIPGGAVLSAAVSGAGQLKGSVGAKRDENTVGLTPLEEDRQRDSVAIQGAVQKSQQAIQTLTSVFRSAQDVARAFVRNLRT